MSVVRCSLNRQDHTATQHSALGAPVTCVNLSSNQHHPVLPLRESSHLKVIGKVGDS